MTSNNENENPKKGKDKFEYMKKAEALAYGCSMFIFGICVLVFICWALSLSN